MKTSELIDEATSLPIEERAKVLDSLLQTFSRADDTHATEWLEIAQRRLAELRAGEVEAIAGHCRGHAPEPQARLLAGAPGSSAA